MTYAGKSYVSVRGSVDIVEYLDQKKELKSKVNEKFMQTSYDNPNIVLIRINTEDAEYWDTGDLTKNIAFLYKRMAGEYSRSADINETIELNS